MAKNNKYLTDVGRRPLDAKQYGEVVKQLRELPSSDLFTAGVAALSDLDAAETPNQRVQSNRAISLFFGALHGTHEEVSLAFSALRSVQYTMKVACIDLIAEHTPPGGAEALVNLLDLHASAGELDVDIRKSVIDALWSEFRASEFFLRVIEYLHDQDARVRWAAVDYFESLELRDAAPQITTLLIKECDPDVFAAALDCVGNWRYIAALPVLLKRREALCGAAPEFVKLLNETITLLMS